MLNILILILGFGVLIKGADFLVDGASSLAKRFKISDLAIGLTVVSFGTSAPELIVNILASAAGSPDIAIGNVIGSNIANVFLILGVAAIIYPLRVVHNTVWKEIPFTLLAALVLWIMVNDQLVDGFGFLLLTRSEGLVLLTFFIIYMYYVFAIAKEEDTADQKFIKKLGTGKSTLLVVIGIIGLALGGQWVVSSATSLATAWGVSASLIGLTIVAIGTSLPELATSAVAAFKKNADIAVGNVVGSNIFNIFWILGLSSVIRPLVFKPSNNIDIGVVVFSGILLFAFMFIGKKHALEKWQGVLFTIMYAAYVTFLIVQG